VNCVRRKLDKWSDVVFLIMNDDVGVINMTMIYGVLCVDVYFGDDELLMYWFDDAMMCWCGDMLYNDEL
jgi:hypothetical protein